MQENPGKRSLGYEKESPARYALEGTTKKYLASMEFYSERWKFEGKKSVQAYRSVNILVKLQLAERVKMQSRSSRT